MAKEQHGYNVVSILIRSTDTSIIIFILKLIEYIYLHYIHNISQTSVSSISFVCSPTVVRVPHDPCFFLTILKIK